MDASELTRRRQARTVFRGFSDQKEYNERTNTVANNGAGVNIGTKMSGS